MSYVMPPNNVIRILMNPDSPAAEDARRSIFGTDQELQQRNQNNTPHGVGPIPGWGTGRGK